MITEMRALWLVEDCVIPRQNFKMADSRFVSVTDENDENGREEFNPEEYEDVGVLSLYAYSKQLKQNGINIKMNIYNIIRRHLSNYNKKINRLSKYCSTIPRLRLGDYSPKFTPPSANNCWTIQSNVIYWHSIDLQETSWIIWRSHQSSFTGKFPSFNIFSEQTGIQKHNWQ